MPDDRRDPGDESGPVVERTEAGRRDDALEDVEDRDDDACTATERAAGVPVDTLSLPAGVSAFPTRQTCIP